MLMFSISMLNVSPPPPPPLWQVRRQLAATILLTVPSPNLGLCAHEGGGRGSEGSCADRGEEAEEEEEEQGIRSIFTTS